MVANAYWSLISPRYIRLQYTTIQHVFYVLESTHLCIMTVMFSMPMLLYGKSLMWFLGKKAENWKNTLIWKKAFFSVYYQDSNLLILHLTRC
nr:MAG TPA: hypothetical protein [Bacteriophage sp.]